MPCTVVNCNRPNGRPNEVVRFRGVSYWLCADHQSWFRTAANQAPPTPAQLADAKLLFIAINAVPLFEQSMWSLVNEAAQRHGNALTRLMQIKHENLHLSKELRFYETQCWFGEQPKIFAGLLSSAEFLHAMANGYMVKDPGPGPQHGEFSHRLQWHVLMRVMTADFTVARTAE